MPERRLLLGEAVVEGAFSHSQREGAVVVAAATGENRENRRLDGEK